MRPVTLVRISRPVIQPHVRFAHAGHTSHTHGSDEACVDGVCPLPHTHDHGPQKKGIARIISAIIDWVKAFFHGLYLDIKELLSFSKSSTPQQHNHSHDHEHDHDHEHHNHPPLTSTR